MSSVWRTLTPALLLAFTSAQGAEVFRYRPDGCLVLFDRLGKHAFGGDDAKPVVHEIAVDLSAIETTLPTRLTPYLQRPAETFSERVENLGRARKVLDPFKEHVRDHRKSLGEIPSDELVPKLIPENQAHTYAISISESENKGFVSFSPTSPGKVDDQFSKHAIVAHDTDNTRAAGLLWRGGKDEKSGKDVVCFNTDSGTYMKAKKRARAGLEAPPSYEAVLSVLQLAFPAAVIRFCAGEKGAPVVTRDPGTNRPVPVMNETIPPGYLQAEVDDAIAKDFEDSAKRLVKTIQPPPAGITLDKGAATTTKNFGTKVLLITPEQLSALPEGTVLVGLNDKPFIVSKNPHLNQANLYEIEQEIRGRIVPAHVKSGFLPVGYPKKTIKKAKQGH